jgi:hypothetical protein
MGEIEIREVVNRADLNFFIDLPWAIYEKYPQWIPPLKSQVRKLLNTRKHPYWEFAQRTLFTAWKNGQIQGRVAAVIDTRYNEFHSEKMCSFGFFESTDDPEIAQALMNSVAVWGQQNGMSFIRGPLNPSTNYEIGMLTDGFDKEPSIMMPYNPAYYIDLMDFCGFSKEKDIYALYADRTSHVSERFQRLAKRIRRNKDITIRNVRKKDFRREILILRDIYNEAWSNNWGFVPMTDSEFSYMAEELMKIMDQDLVFFIYYKNEPAGFCLVLPNINPILKALNGKIGFLGLFKLLKYKNAIDSARCLALGIKLKYHNLGIPLVALDFLWETLARKTYYMTLEVGWNLEDNLDIIKYEEEAGCKIYKTYRIFRKELP